MLKDDDLAGQIIGDWRTADLDDRRRAMLVYAEKLTLTPADVTAADIEMLRSQGLSDRDVLDLVEVVAYFAFANRIADGLGITLEPWGDFGDG